MSVLKVLPVRSVSLACVLLCAGFTPLDAATGWTDMTRYLVRSDGSRSLGSAGGPVNDTRDSGSKLLYFDTAGGDNATAEVYWWDGTNIVDPDGSTTNPDNGETYGTDPFGPNLTAIRPFRTMSGTRCNADGDLRLRTHKYGTSNQDCLAAGHPDWYLFRRGQTHRAFQGAFTGGRSATEPMGVAAYGPLGDGRAIMDPDADNPFSRHTGGEEALWLHVVYCGLDIRAPWGHVGAHDSTSDSHNGGDLTALVEDCRWVFGPPEGRITYTPATTTIRRSVIGFSWNPDAHNQGYFTNKFRAATTFDEVIFYKNGYKNDPRLNADPRRDIFSRNVYQGGGRQMGFTYRNVISADGASGGPQMRLGGLIENSLIIEGYWYSSTHSNSVVNPWLTAGKQSGSSAIVRNNVQFVFGYPTPRDPDTDGSSDTRAQPAWGYALQGSSFGATVENNIITGAMLIDELGGEEARRGQLRIGCEANQYQDGSTYYQKDNTLRGNICYRTGSGLALEGDGWSGASNIVVEDNVFVSGSPVTGVNGSGVSSSAQLNVRNNRFYSDVGPLPGGDWMGAGNTLASYASAASAESWPDPDRTLRRYVTEELGLALLDWDDDPYLGSGQRSSRASAGETYDPTGLKTFMAVATNMRRGGATPIPGSGKPSWTADYPWDTRFTAAAVVDWVREGFGREPVKAARARRSAATPRNLPLGLRARPGAYGGYELLLRAPRGVPVSLAVYDLAGRLVHDLGTHTTAGDVAKAVWDGRGMGGGACSRQLLTVVGRARAGARVALQLVVLDPAGE